MEVMKEDVEMAFVLPLCETGFKFVEKCIEKSERKRYKRNIFRDGVHDEKGERVVIGFPITIIGESKDGCKQKKKFFLGMSTRLHYRFYLKQSRSTYYVYV